MHSSIKILASILALYYSAAAANATTCTDSTNRCTPTPEYDCASAARIAARTQLSASFSLPTFSSSSYNFSETQTIFPPSEPFITPHQPTHTSPSTTTTSAPTTSSSSTSVAQKSFYRPSNPRTEPLPQPSIWSLSTDDMRQCHLQPHCLLCTDPTTILTCYKHNCQCQRGDLRHRYMPAPIDSCHNMGLCLSCPASTVPFVWDRMAVCLGVWKHQPVKGERSPLTGWTEKGFAWLPIGRVPMGAAPGGRDAGTLVLLLWITGPMIAIAFMLI